MNQIDNPLLAASLCVSLAALLCACEPQPKDSPGPQASTSDVGITKPQDPKIAGLYGVEVLLSEYDTTLKRAAIFSPEMELRSLPPELLKAPHFQHRTVINLLDLALVNKLAAEKGLLVTPEETEDFLQGEPKLARFAKLDTDQRAKLLGEFGLTPADLNNVCRDRVINRKLSQALTPSPSEEDLWRDYKRIEERIQLNFIKVPNTPSSKAIDEFVATQGAAIEAKYKRTPDQFKVKASRKVRVLRLDLEPKASASKVREVRKALDALRLRALGGEDFEKLVKDHSQHPNAKAGGSLGYVLQRQRPQAFKIAVGDISEPIRDGHGLFVIKVEEEMPAHTQALSSAIRREIAAGLIRLGGPLKGALEDARAVSRAWSKVEGGPKNTSAELDALMKAKLLRRGKTFPFNTDVADETFISGIGKAPQIMRAARALKPEAPVSADPILFKGQLYVLALVKKGKATRTAFEAEKGAFKKEWIKRRKARVIDERLESIKREGKIFINLKPVQDKHGVIRHKTQ